MKKEKTYHWPYWFSCLLPSVKQEKIKPILASVRRGQVFLWDALNIYDSFFDGEGKREELPLANSYLRRFLEIHYRLNLPDSYYNLFNRIINDLDRANQEEIEEKKLKIKNGTIILPAKLPIEKKYETLSRKSLALALGPLSLLSFAGHAADNKKMKAALNFFKYFLAAKQLSDDSLDWLEDLENGLITNANLPILRAAKKKHLKLNIKKSLDILNLLFAGEASPIIIKEIKGLCLKARKQIYLVDNNPKNILIRKLIKPMEKACYKAEKFRSLLLGS